MQALSSVKLRLMQKNTPEASVVSWGMHNRLVKVEMSSPASQLRMRKWNDVLTHKEHRHMSPIQHDIWAAYKLMIGLATKYNFYLKFI